MDRNISEYWSGTIFILDIERGCERFSYKDPAFLILDNCAFRIEISRLLPELRSQILISATAFFRTIPGLEVVDLRPDAEINPTDQRPGVHQRSENAYGVEAGVPSRPPQTREM
jgi:hypothetical protein